MSLTIGHSESGFYLCAGTDAAQTTQLLDSFSTLLKVHDRQINVLQLERDFELPASSHSTLKDQRCLFKMELIRAYDTPTATQIPSHLTCMVTGAQMPHDEIKATHLFAKAKHVVSSDCQQVLLIPQSLLAIAQCIFAKE